MGATHIKLKGTFTFEINESGLDYNNEEERQEAIDDFLSELEEWVETSQSGYVEIKYDEDDMIISEGEE